MEDKKRLCANSHKYGFETRLTPKEAATGLRIHLGGFFICVMVAEGAVD